MGIQNRVFSAEVVMMPVCVAIKTFKDIVRAKEKHKQHVAGEKMLLSPFYLFIFCFCFFNDVVKRVCCSWIYFLLSTSKRLC